MALTNAERQRRFRQRRVKSGEQVRLEFRVSQAHADAFKALTKRWKTSQTDAFLRLCMTSAKDDGAGKRKPVPSRAAPAAPTDALEQVDAALTDVSNWIAWSASDLKSRDDKELAFQLSSDVAKLRRRILKRYPGNESLS